MTRIATLTNMTESAANIPIRRLFAQRVAGVPFEQPEEAVRWLGAVQAQEYPLARWALGTRVRDATDASVAEAFDAGRILRTHLLRPTWHFVLPEDIRWLLALTAPRVHQLNGPYYRKFELTSAILARCHALIAAELADGKQRTRPELALALAHGGVLADGPRLSYIMMHAELEGLICSGAMRGKQHTYALLDDRVPHARMLTGDEALAELTLRYFTGHGPATLNDFVRWSGLTVSAARQGLGLVGAALVKEHNGASGQAHWSSANAQPPSPAPPMAYLLHEYDEAIIYKDVHFRDLPWSRERATWNDTFYRPILLDGQRAGTWRRTVGTRAVAFEAQVFATLDSEQTAALTDALDRYSTYMGLPVEFRYV